MATEATRILRASDVHTRLDLRGEGEVVAVYDTGLDTGRLDRIHPSFEGRVVRAIPYGRSDWDDPDGHGTHVCGCIGGGGQGADGVEVVGPAPEAKLIIQSVFKTKLAPFGFQPLSFARVLAEAFSAGARIHSNSWIGERSSTQYSDDATELDTFVHGHPEMCVITAVGNSGGFTVPGRPNDGTLKSPSMAKNCISVGASESSRTGFRKRYREFFPKDMHAAVGAEILNREWSSDANRAAPFSGHGPTLDGRIKPDVVAPGTSIIAARSRNAKVRSVWGESNDPNYVLLGGTSSAAPLVAGCAAVARQFAKRQGISDPTFAVVKSLLIGGTHRIDGLDEEAAPDNCQGWGRVDLLMSLNPASAIGNETMAVHIIHDLPAMTTVGRAAEYRIRVATAGLPFRATLVWTDTPGSGLRNDLDLTVNVPGLPARLGNQPVGGSAYDRKNNIEQVRIRLCPAGEVRIFIDAFRIDTPPSCALVLLGAFGANVPIKG